MDYNFDLTGSQGHYKAYLLGKNTISKNWDTLNTNLPSSYSLSNINARQYDYLKVYYSLVDSALGADQPMKLKSLNVDYSYPPEITLFPGEISFAKDTLLQGFNNDMTVKVHNVGYSDADSLTMNFTFNELDTLFYSKLMSLKVDSSKTINYSISTDHLLYTSPLSYNSVTVDAKIPSSEYFTFNNAVTKGFYVSRDSIKPTFNITFDGKEIIDGDVVSATPKVLITLKDNSPLPLDTSDFTIVYDNYPLNFNSPDIEYTYTPYPNSESTILWTPTLPDGVHTLEVLAKDASGNFFDTTSQRITFEVANSPQLKNVYNYPNPFKTDTYFTFQVGSIIPETFDIKIFTVAGRLIREINVPSSELQPGFNRIYWNGRDQDGDDLANGLYFYKIIAKMAGEVKTVTQKLAKIQ